MSETETRERLTDDEWREFQRIPDQGYSHRGWVDRAIARRLAAARAEHLAFTDALGFGDGVTEPAATLAQMIDPIRQAFEDAGEHIECPLRCESCGERLADTLCPQCNGGGCLPNAAMAYLECDTCAGVGRIHEGCAEASYAELAAELARLRGVVEAVQALADEREAEWPDLHTLVLELRDALAPVSSSGEAESGEAHPQFSAFRDRVLADPETRAAYDEVMARDTTPAPVPSGGQVQASGPALAPAVEGLRLSVSGGQADGEAVRDAAAAAVYGDDNALRWIVTYDGTPNTAAYEYADRALAARPVLSREAIRARLDEHWPYPDMPGVHCGCGHWASDPTARAAAGDQYHDHLADVLDGGRS